MGLRELTVSEISQVSGGSCSPTFDERMMKQFQNVFTLLEVAHAYSVSDPRYYGMSDTFVAATNPVLRKAITAELNKAGADGYKAVDNWLKAGC